MIDGRAFREAIRTVTVSYPIPFHVSVLRRPELLRSERFTLLHRYFEVIGDTTMTPADRDRVTALLLSTQGDETRKTVEQGNHAADDQSGDSDA